MPYLAFEGPTGARYMTECIVFYKIMYISTSKQGSWGFAFTLGDKRDSQPPWVEQARRQGWLGTDGTGRPQGRAASAISEGDPGKRPRSLTALGEARAAQTVGSRRPPLCRHCLWSDGAGEVINTVTTVTTPTVKGRPLSPST